MSLLGPWVVRVGPTCAGVGRALTITAVGTLSEIEVGGAPPWVCTGFGSAFSDCLAERARW